MSNISGLDHQDSVLVPTTLVVTVDDAIVLGACIQLCLVRPWKQIVNSSVIMITSLSSVSWPKWAWEQVPNIGVSHVAAITYHLPS